MVRSKGLQQMAKTRALVIGNLGALPWPCSTRRRRVKTKHFDNGQMLLVKWSITVLLYNLTIYTLFILGFSRGHPVNWPILGGVGFVASALFSLSVLLCHAVPGGSERDDIELHKQRCRWNSLTCHTTLLTRLAASWRYIRKPARLKFICQRSEYGGCGGGQSGQTVFKNHEIRCISRFFCSLMYQYANGWR